MHVPFWELVGRLDLSLYHAEIEAVEGHAGRDHTDPQLLISVWLYAYSRGISSAREVARQCEFEPGFQWLCGLKAISHRTLSGFRSESKAALDDLFVQVLGMISAEGLITLERVTLDGTKIKANASGNTFRRKEKLQAHLELAREQVRILNGRRRTGGEHNEATSRGSTPSGTTTSESIGSGGTRSGAATRREETRSQRVRGTLIEHGPGRACDEKRRRWHRTELQRTTTHRHNTRHGGERRGDH